ncbi:hypothetical protein D0962_26735 [Leptolyngbyaceae cyanobacterium CCMR0082]|uniref:Uncharacterized protein n=3 Tax=Adonisia TaxID=2950183 RepID=A0A6M0SE30_9CYAN|nr:hypothetical protein [Adonisia turfae CCMR0081]NEZ66313.1 hypothetical protein [Adonisia turfae CCMR0082]
MTWFSLKRTLQSNLASSIEVLNPINQDVPRLNLHTHLRYSAVLLSIGKTTQICHQNIPLKKVNCNGTVTYISAISRKLATIWQQPSDDIANMLLSILRQQTTPPLWSSVHKTRDGWLEFVISQRGMAQWQQQLEQWILPLAPSPWPITPEDLWQLQSAYELCCRWQTRDHQRDFLTTRSAARSIERGPTETFQTSWSPLQALIHCLLDICDRWHQTTSPQLLRQVQQLVLALAACTTPINQSPEVFALRPWLESTRIVLKQSVNGRLGYQLAERL